MVLGRRVTRGGGGIVFAAVLLLCTTAARGIILHPAGQPDPLRWTGRPPADVLGRWGLNASCVALSPTCVATTRHQGGGVGTPVEIAGQMYTVRRVWAHPEADLRIAELAGANLTHFVGIQEDPNEVGRPVVLAGYGNGRGALLLSAGIVYGYRYDGRANGILRFGTNRIDGADMRDTERGFHSDVLTGDFDGLQQPYATPYESIPAVYDSGGGWFLQDGAAWRLAGLSRSAQIHFAVGHEGDPNYAVFDEAWFRSRSAPAEPAPDYFDAVRISSYAAWATQVLSQAPAGDLDGDCKVDYADFAVLAGTWGRIPCEDDCVGADLDADGDVDLADLLAVVRDWTQGVAVPSGGSAAVPRD